MGALVAAPALSDTPLRVANYTVNLHRDGPGLLLRDLQRGTEDTTATAAVIAHVAPDVLVLTGIDYDADALALSSYADLIKSRGGPDYLYRRGLRGNSGRPTGRDVDGDGLLGGPRDAHGYGNFSGQGAMAILSIYPIRAASDDAARLIWSQQPGAIRPDGTTDPVWAELMLMERGGWTVTLDGPDSAFEIWAAHGSPPVFDGPEDRNGLRNAAQLTYWVDQPITRPVVLAGDLNLDPVDGEGRKSAIRALLNSAQFQDPQPASAGADAAGQLANSAAHSGPHRLDTVDWGSGPGNLRVDYVLPSSHWRVLDAGVFWPAPDDPLAGLLRHDGVAGSRHRLVWVDLVLER